MSERSGAAGKELSVHPELLRKGKYLNLSTTRAERGVRLVE
jgi:hypothetical protein